MSTSRKRRGRESEFMAGDWYSQWWPDLEVVGSAAPGRDIKRMLGLAPEVKARRDLDLLAWLRQAKRNAAGDIPWVLWRPDGLGEARIAEWPVIMRNDDHVELLLEAGYGVPLDPAA